MYYEEETSDAPRIYRPDIATYLRFKAKDGVFEIYDAVTKEKKQVKELTILPVNDSRFTVKPAMNEPGIFMFSGLYRSSKQKITVLQQKDGKTSIYKEGTWDELKPDANLKFTKMLYCMLKDGDRFVTAEFQLQGVSMIMWGDISAKGTDGIMTLSVSAEKNFKTKLGAFYSMIGAVTGKPDEQEDAAARHFGGEVKRAFDSHDENYKYHQGEVPKAEKVNPEPKEDIPTINLDEEPPFDPDKVYGTDGEEVAF